VALIESTRVIRADAAVVYEAAKDVEKFPDVLPDLNSVTVLENNGNGETVTKWDGSVAMGPLKRSISWTERDFWDDEGLKCTFELIEGDMKRYSGIWLFVKEGENCRVELSVDFELGIPMLGSMVNRIVDQLMKDNCDALLGALDRITTG